MATKRTTINNIAATVTLLVIAAAVAIPMVSRNRMESRKAKNEAQLRGLITAMVTWASSGQAFYPTPPEFDPYNETVPEPGESKISTSNVLSMLVFMGNVQPESLVSPSDTGDVTVMRNFSYNSPPTAVKPINAVWDPAFRGTAVEPLRLPGGAVDPAKKAPANQSYAHIPPLGKRRCQWSDTYNPAEPSFSNRGPTYAASDAAPRPSDGGWKLIEGPTGGGSTTLGMYGDRAAWQGFVAFNDTHVTFEQSPTPAGCSYINTRGYRAAAVSDNVFVDEDDEVRSREPLTIDERLNAYLRPIYRVPGEQRYRVWRD